MGIHDVNIAAGSLVHSTHAGTGKMIDTGAAMEIASDIGELGEGGQILVTQGVAQWLRSNEWLFTRFPFVVDPLRDHAIPHINCHLELYQVLPEQVAKRRQVFAAQVADMFPDMCSTTSETTLRNDSPQAERFTSPKLTPFRSLL
ncbi:hypothetical protein PRIC1_011578 [Phytophthora ramorum]